MPKTALILLGATGDVTNDEDLGVGARRVQSRALAQCGT